MLLLSIPRVKKQLVPVVIGDRKYDFKMMLLVNNSPMS